MNLQQYIDLSRRTPSDVARAAGVSPGTLHDLLTGRRKPSVEMMQKIRIATDGHVTADSWLPGLPPDPAEEPRGRNA